MKEISIIAGRKNPYAAATSHDHTRRLECPPVLCTPLKFSGDADRTDWQALKRTLQAGCWSSASVRIFSSGAGSKMKRLTHRCGQCVQVQFCGTGLTPVSEPASCCSSTCSQQLHTQLHAYLRRIENTGAQKSGESKGLGLFAPRHA